MKNSLSENVFVFCDFDGTITRKDSGDAFFTRFSEFEPAHSKLMKGNYTVAEYYQYVVSHITPAFSTDDLHSFTDSCDVDAYFSQFIDLVKSFNWQLHIVSDGFDTYINPIIQKVLNAHDIPIYCNSLIPIENQLQQYMPVFPYADERCSCFCASCKRKVVLGLSHQESLIIYIGDGLSDTCPVHYADMVFAKGALASYCNSHGIVHHSWNTFFDIIAVLKKRKPVKRDIARKERQKAFIAE